MPRGDNSSISRECLSLYVAGTGPFRDHESKFKPPILPCASSPADQLPPEERFKPGTLILVKLVAYSFWPAMIVTPDHFPPKKSRKPIKVGKTGELIEFWPVQLLGHAHYYWSRESDLRVLAKEDAEVWITANQKSKQNQDPILTRAYHMALSPPTLEQLLTVKEQVQSESPDRRPPKRKRKTKTVLDPANYDDDEFPVGQLVLMRVTGFPPWPAMVVTPEHFPKNARAQKPKKKAKLGRAFISLPVQFFGDVPEYSWSDGSDISILTVDEIREWNEHHRTPRANEKKVHRDLRRSYEIAANPPSVEEMKLIFDEESDGGNELEGNLTDESDQLEGNLTDESDQLEGNLSV